jgi:hypothetical protein
MSRKKRSPRMSKTHRVDGNNDRWEQDLVAWPTAGAIRAALEGVPDDAYVRIKTHDWWWPRWSWTIFAWWGIAQPKTDDEKLADREAFLRERAGVS